MKAVIFRADRCLILKRFAAAPQYPNYWDLPGGGVSEGESLEHALLREVREETGLTVRVLAPFHAELLRWPLETGVKVPSVGISYFCDLPGDAGTELRLTEHSRSAWVARRELSHYRMSRLCADALRAAFALRPATDRPATAQR